jgi:hypothetical protein
LGAAVLARAVAEPAAAAAAAAIDAAAAAGFFRLCFSRALIVCSFA